jgi:anti-sigma factor RsiW
MCEFSGQLIAWMDGEFAGNDASVVEGHVQDCAQCREQVAAYEDVSRDFAAYCDATLRTATAAKPHRKLPRWVPVAVGAATAAAILLLALLPRTAKPVPPVPQLAVATPPAVEVPAARPLKPVARRHVAAQRKAPSQNRAMAGPAIQIEIPADAMFPPGAVPEGVTYIANLSLTDGSVQAIRLQP